MRPGVQREERCVEDVNVRSAAEPAIRAVITPELGLAVTEVDGDWDRSLVMLAPGPSPPLRRVVAEIADQRQADIGIRTQKLQERRTQRRRRIEVADVADAEHVGAVTDRGVAIAAPTVMSEQVGPADEVRGLGG